MKICHCINLNTQEKAALETVQKILHEISKDSMIYTDFENQRDGKLDDISAWFDEVVYYLGNFGD